MDGERSSIMLNKIGFMQGRLSPSVGGKIQAFPEKHWREEFVIAHQIGLSLMEWTIDHQGFAENPLISEFGRIQIKELQDNFGLRIPSVTADNMMQAPFWKADVDTRNNLLLEFYNLVEACGQLGISYVVVPLVDNGSLASPADEDALLEGMHLALPYLKSSGVRVAFESDFEPSRLAAFIERFPAEFGINFDMGNSAALGWSPTEEIPVIAPRMLNVHVKDRLRGGGTVPFGEGNVDFDSVFRTLREHKYEGAYIIQGARARDGNDVGALLEYSRLVKGFLDAE